MLLLLVVTVFVLLAMMITCNAGYVRIAGVPPGANPVISELAMDKAGIDAESFGINGILNTRWIRGKKVVGLWANAQEKMPGLI